MVMIFKIFWECVILLDSFQNQVILWKLQDNLLFAGTGIPYNILLLLLTSLAAKAKTSPRHRSAGKVHWSVHDSLARNYSIDIVFI